MSQEQANVVHPPLDELLPTPQAKERFEESAAALEAAELVRALRSQALTPSGTRGISQTELAQRVGLSQPRISQIEKGEGRDGLTYAVIRKIANACGVNWRDVIQNALDSMTQNAAVPARSEARHAQDVKQVGDRLKAAGRHEAVAHNRLYRPPFAAGWGMPSLRRFFNVEPAVRYESSFSVPSPTTDISEDETAYKVTAELPGMSEKDIDVSLANGTLTLKGEKRQEKEQKDKNYYLSERSYGSFQRTFSVPEGVDWEKIAADFSKGVLTITMPKTAKAVEQQKKLIEVKSGAYLGEDLPFSYSIKLNK